MVRWYYLATIFFLLQAMQATGIISRRIYGEWDGKPGDKITTLLNLLFILTSLLLASRGFGIRRIGRGGIFALGLASCLLLSTASSADPQINKAILYLFVVIGAIGISRNLECDEFMRLLGLSCLASAITSLVVEVAYPDPMFDFRGIFSHKIFLGRPWRLPDQVRPFPCPIYFAPTNSREADPCTLSRFGKVSSTTYASPASSKAHSAARVTRHAKIKASFAVILTVLPLTVIETIETTVAVSVFAIGRSTILSTFSLCRLRRAGSVAGASHPAGTEVLASVSPSKAPQRRIT